MVAACGFCGLLIARFRSARQARRALQQPARDEGERGSRSCVAGSFGSGTPSPDGVRAGLRELLGGRFSR